MCFLLGLLLSEIKDCWQVCKDLLKRNSTLFFSFDSLCIRWTIRDIGFLLNDRFNVWFLNYWIWNKYIVVISVNYHLINLFRKLHLLLDHVLRHRLPILLGLQINLLSSFLLCFLIQFFANFLFNSFVLYSLSLLILLSNSSRILLFLFFLSLGFQLLLGSYLANFST